MYYVKPTSAAIGARGQTPFDTVRRTRLPANAFRPVTMSARWARLAREGSVTLVQTDNILETGAAAPKGGKSYIRQEDVEGYEAPAKAEAVSRPCSEMPSTFASSTMAAPAEKE